MAYYVIGDDGQKYGPADIATLNQWIAENRLVRTQMLEDESSGARMAASAVEGLNFPAAGPAPGGPMPPGGYPGSPGYAGAYPRGGGYIGDDGSNDVRNAWLFVVVGLCCCALLQIGAIVMGGRAQAKGNPGGLAPKVVGIVLLVLQLIGGIAWAILGTSLRGSSGLPPLH